MRLWCNACTNFIILFFFFFFASWSTGLTFFSTPSLDGSRVLKIIMTWQKMPRNIFLKRFYTTRGPNLNVIWACPPFILWAREFSAGRGLLEGGGGGSLGGVSGWCDGWTANQKPWRMVALPLLHMKEGLLSRMAFECLGKLLESFDVFSGCEFYLLHVIWEQVLTVMQLWRLLKRSTGGECVKCVS